MLRKHLYRIRAMPYFLWTTLFTITPLIFIIYYSFKVKDESFVFTFDNYKKFFTPTYVKIIFVSLKLSLISTLLCLILGFPAGFFLSRIKYEKRRNIFVLLFIMPLWTNFLLRTYSWMSIFREQGIINQMLMNFGFIDSPIKFLNNKANKFSYVELILIPLMLISSIYYFNIFFEWFERYGENYV